MQTSVSNKILSAIVAPPPALPNSTAATQAANGGMSRGSSTGEIVPAPDAVVTAPGSGAGKAESRYGYEYPPASAAAAAVPALPPTMPPQISQTTRMQVSNDVK